MSAVHGGADGDRKRNKKRALVVIAGLVAASGVGSLAFAYWTESGSGTGTATTGGTSSVTLNPSNSPSGLYPGGPAQTINGTIDNPNASNVTLSTLTESVSVVNGAPSNGKPACTASDFTFTNPSFGNGGVVSPGNGGGSFSVDIAMVNSATNQDNCKNVTLDITYNAS
jgi:hypothetical protein